MSERVGSDIEELWILMKIHISSNSESINYELIVIHSLSLSDPTLSDIDFVKMVWIWTTLKMSKCLKL